MGEVMKLSIEGFRIITASLSRDSWGYVKTMADKKECTAYEIIIDLVQKRQIKLTQEQRDKINGWQTVNGYDPLPELHERF
jgi:hypothetical protein